MKKTKKAIKKRAKRAARRVDRDAYTFNPSILMEVGIDPANQRVMVVNVGRVATGPILAVFERALAHEAKLLMTKIRMEAGEALGRACSHPRSRIKRVEQRDYAQQEMTINWVKMCTKCGCVIR